jgi:hypothetical protein
MIRGRAANTFAKSGEKTLEDMLKMSYRLLITKSENKG